MRRLIRHGFTLCAALSLLLCAATCVLWVRSYALTDRLAWRRADGFRALQTARGHVVLRLELSDWSGRPAAWHGLTHERDAAPTPLEGSGLVWMFALSVGPGDTWVHWERGGFGWGQWQARGGGALIATGYAPFWGVAAATAVTPLAWAAARWRASVRRRRRKDTGLCPVCGYDCRATPARCPECGTAATTDGNA